MLKIQYFCSITKNSRRIISSSRLYNDLFGTLCDASNPHRPSYGSKRVYYPFEC